MTLKERVNKIFAEHNINYDCDYYNSLGMLTNGTQLHDSITSTLNSATQLLQDIRENPEKYLSVRLKLF